MELDELIEAAQTNLHGIETFKKGKCFCGVRTKNPKLYYNKTTMYHIFLVCDNCSHQYEGINSWHLLTIKEVFAIKCLM